VLRNFIRVFFLSLVLYASILLLLRYVFDFIPIAEAVLLTTFSAFGLLGLFYLLKNRFRILVKDLIISILVLYITFWTILGNVDRSRSVYVLSWVGNNLVQIKPTGYDLKLVNSYAAKDFVGIEMRLQEHIDRNLIKSNDSEVSLTIYGSALLEFIKLSANVFNLHGFFKNSN
jgi:hypothetical protein